MFFLALIRYIMVSKISDTRGEAWVSAFNEEAEKIVGCSADELDKVKSEVKKKHIPMFTYTCMLMHIRYRILTHRP